MEKKENKTRLRLVKTEETIADEKTRTDLQQNIQLHGKLAQQMNSFADELDRMIESILRS